VRYTVPRRAGHAALAAGRHERPHSQDRLIVKLFYTACCVWAAVIMVALALLTRDPDSDRWDPSAANVATVYLLTLFVLLPIWMPFVRRQYSGLPRSPLEALRAIWAFFAPFAATLILWISLGLPLTFLFSSNDSTRALALLVALAGSALIVLLSWDVAADRDLGPPRGVRTERRLSR
jgi:hypothetical protein